MNYGEVVREQITEPLIELNWEKYELLKKQDAQTKKAKVIEVLPVEVKDVDIQKLIEKIFYRKIDNSRITNNLFEANKLREAGKDRLKQKLNPNCTICTGRSWVKEGKSVL